MIYVEYTLECDNCGEFKQDLDITTLTYKAEKEGWVTFNGLNKHYCPKCWDYDNEQMTTQLPFL